MNASHDDLAGVFRRHRGRLLLAALLVLATMLAGVGLLALSGGFLTAAALAGVAGAMAGFNFFSPSAGIRALTLVRIASRYGEKLVGHDVTLRIARDLRVWFFRRALPLAPGRLSGNRIGELLARLMSDIGEVDGLLVRALAPLLALLGTGLIGVAAAAALWWPAALLLAALCVAVGCLVPWQVARGAREREQLRAAQRTELRTLAFEGLEGAADLRALQAEADWTVRVDLAAAALRRGDRLQRNRLVAGNMLHLACGGFGLVAMIALVLSAGGRAALAPEQGAALVFLTLAMLEVWSGAGLAWQALQSGRVAAQRLQAIVEQPVEVADPPLPVAAPAGGVLRADGLRFGWNAQRTVLDGLDLQLAPGERIAIGGDSGCGKSTLSALLLRLRDPQQGRLSYDGVDLRTLAQADWHRRIAWLPQQAPVFAGSLRDNLAIGDPQADDTALWQALAKVRLQDWARQRDGLQTWVGENGVTMSAGQARRLALARALLRKAPILLLDEPTEGLDVDTAHALLHDLVAALDGASLLMITHDALPAGVVQRHYRLQDGRLVERDPA